MNLSRKIIIGILVLTSALSSNCLNGTVLKILNNETTEKLIQERIYFEYPFQNSLLMKKIKIDKYGDFSFPCNNFPKVGKEIQLKLSNKDYFILSPFNGKLFVPSQENIYKKILIVSKKSSIFLKTCVEVTDQTIQVLVTKEQGKAEELVNQLRQSCISKKGSYYCKKHIKYEAFLEGNMLNKLAYKVYYGKYFPDYKSQKNLNKDLQFIQKYFSRKAWIRPYINVKEECR